MTNDYESKNLGKMLKQRRVMLLLTLQKLGDTSGVSPSHLGRIERGGEIPVSLNSAKNRQAVRFGGR